MNATGFGLAVQSLRTNQQVLLLGHVVGTRNGDGWFSTSDVSEMLEALRLPMVPNISAVLGNLRKTSLVVRRSNNPPWALSPLGTNRAVQLLGHVDYAQIEAQLVGSAGAEYAHVVHPVIPPAFAPPRWQPGIERLLQRFPFETNVFLMTRFPKPDSSALPDPVGHVVEVARTVVGQHGLNLHLASDRQIDDDLLGNVGAYTWACQYGIGLLENRLPNGPGLNSNMVIEIGSMIITGRRCAILKDRTSPPPPSDLSGQIYKSVDFDRLDSVSAELHKWIAEDLGLGRCRDCSAPANASLAQATVELTVSSNGHEQLHHSN